MLEPGQTLTWDVYNVQTTWPTESGFGNYRADAYTHKDNPGPRSLLTTHPDVFEGRIVERVNARSPVWVDGLWFDNRLDALRVAAFIQAVGRVTAGWDGPEDWREKYRVELQARVVHVFGGETCTEVRP